MSSWFLPGCLMVLSLLSLLLLKSVAPSLAGTQFIFFCLGFAAFLVISRIPYSVIEQWRWVGYLGLCGLLLVPLAIGTTTRGIAGWIDIGGFFSVQPSQLAIPIVTVIVAHLIKSQPKPNFATVMKIILVAGIPGILILIEPDLGTSVIYALTLASILFLSPVPLKYLMSLAALAVVAAILGWIFVLKPYQKARITSFMGNSESAQAQADASYNARQALIAVGSGELLGRGLGQGVQSHLRFLPERQTDFIFASLAEELGFIGSSLVILLYLGITLFCLRLAQQTKHQAQRYYAIAAAATLMFQAGVNIGMNMGMLPITGITLPFLSYGGSSIIAMSFFLGIVQSFTYQPRDHQQLHLT